jgi:GNAT superfamily N-acetyltransferase
MPDLRAAAAVTETPFQARALGQLLDLWQQVMPQDAPSAARFRDLALLNPAFRPGGLPMLWRGDRLIGFGYAIADPSALPVPGERRGWLAGLGVAPDERGAGYGTALLQSCRRFLASSGCTVAELGGNGERYLLPGADAAAYPEFVRLIERCGFRRTGSTTAMHCDLPGLASAGALAAGTGYQYRQPDDGHIPELLAVISELSAGWAGLVRSHLARDGGRANLWAAYGPGGIAGFAGFDLFPGCPGRFGPMGVLPSARGHGAGARLLRHSLDSMAGRGHPSAWFLWGPEGAAGRRMYASAGFRVSREFEFFSSDLHAREADRPTKERES